MSPPVQGEFRGSGRFTIERCLGEGGFGAVYAARDRERDTRVALKLLRRLDAGALFRFKQEFRALADIVHPNLVRLYELFSESDQWFFTMELIDGVDFLSYAWGGTGRFDQAPTLAQNEVTLQTQTRTSFCVDFRFTRVSLERVHPIFVQLAEGVAALHAAQKLHRDLKPSNVLVNAQGRAVILDFGLVGEIAPEGPSTNRDMAGTPGYMAPEQFAGAPASTAADWYAVGVMMYEALAGQRLVPAALGQGPLLPGVPAELGTLIRDLLGPVPEQRPSGREVLRRLGAPSALLIAAPADRRTAGLFVGRELQLDALWKAYTESQGGQPVVVGLHGGSGIGKSALAQRWLDDVRARHPEVVVLAARCYERESVPYKAVDSLVDALTQYLKSLDALAVGRLMPRGVLALARLFPVLLQVESVANARERGTESGESRELRRRAFLALKELLARLADHRPVVLFLDDLQWGDIDSGALLAEMLRPPDAPMILLLASYRSEEATSGRLLRTLLPAWESYRPTLQLREVALDRLTFAEARELATALLGGHDGVTAEIIARESGGNPFFVEALAGLSRQRRVGGITEPGRVTLAEVIRGRLTELPADACALLQVVSLAGRPVPRQLAWHAAGCPPEEQGLLASLRFAHLVRVRSGESGDEIEPYHDRIREAVLDALTPSEARGHHLRLGQTLEVHVRTPDPETLAVHFHRGGDLERAATYAAAAAEQAAHALAFDHAARLYRLALELPGSSAARQRMLRMGLGEALANAGRGDEAAQAFLAAAESARAAERLELRRRAAEQLLISGHLEEGLATLRTVLDSVGMKLASTHGSALASLLWRRLLLRLRGLRFRERHAAQIAPEELVRIDACGTVSTGLAIIDNLRSADFQARQALLALRAGEPSRIARAIAATAGHLAIAGCRHQARARRLLETSSALAHRLQDPHVLAILTMMSGVVAFAAGRWRESRCCWQEAERIIHREIPFQERSAAMAWRLSSMMVMNLVALGFLGGFAELARVVPETLRDVEERGDLFNATSISNRMAHMVRLAAGDVEQARRDLDQALWRWLQPGIHMQRYWNLFAHSEVDLYCGDGAAVDARLRENWNGLKRAFVMRVEVAHIEALHLRARAALACAVQGNDPARSLASALRDAAAIEKRRAPWGDALALLVRGTVSAMRGQRRAALEQLAQSQRGLEGVEMAAYAAAALRRRGELLGGEEGRAIVASADQFFTGQGIADPERMTAMLAPGRMG